MASATPTPSSLSLSPPFLPLAETGTQKNKFQYLFFNLSKGLISAFMNVKCECGALAAKVGILALPILFLLEATLAIATFPLFWVANQLCREPSKTPITPMPLNPSSPLSPPSVVPSPPLSRVTRMPLSPSTPPAPTTSILTPPPTPQIIRPIPTPEPLLKQATTLLQPITPSLDDLPIHDPEPLPKQATTLPQPITPPLDDLPIHGPEPEEEVPVDNHIEEEQRAALPLPAAELETEVPEFGTPVINYYEYIPPLIPQPLKNTTWNVVNYVTTTSSWFMQGAWENVKKVYNTAPVFKFAGEAPDEVPEVPLGVLPNIG